MSSSSSGPHLVDDDGVVDSKTSVVTDSDIEELTNLLPPYKRIVSHQELRVKKVAQDLLQRCSGIISINCLMKSIEKDAANFLVEECLFLSTDDLFEGDDDVDPEGYIKYVPDVLDLPFVGRLLNYNIDFSRFVDDKTHIKELFESRIKLTDERNIDNCYKPTAILLISRYSDTATIIKQEGDHYIQFNDYIYTEAKPLSCSKIPDIFDTSGFILVFYHQIQSTVSSQMRIVSRSTMNGIEHIVIQDGTRFFQITPAISNTTAK